jgi:hypothetical protein
MATAARAAQNPAYRVAVPYFAFLMSVRAPMRSSSTRSVSTAGSNLILILCRGHAAAHLPQPLQKSAKTGPSRPTSMAPRKQARAHF